MWQWLNNSYRTPTICETSTTTSDKNRCIYIIPNFPPRMAGALMPASRVIKYFWRKTKALSIWGKPIAQVASSVSDQYSWSSQLSVPQNRGKDPAEYCPSPQWSCEVVLQEQPEESWKTRGVSGFASVKVDCHWHPYVLTWWPCSPSRSYSLLLEYQDTKTVAYASCKSKI